LIFCQTHSAYIQAAVVCCEHDAVVAMDDGNCEGGTSPISSYLSVINLQLNAGGFCEKFIHNRPVLMKL